MRRPTIRCASARGDRADVHDVRARHRRTSSSSRDAQPGGLDRLQDHRAGVRARAREPDLVALFELLQPHWSFETISARAAVDVLHGQAAAAARRDDRGHVRRSARRARGRARGDRERSAALARAAHVRLARDGLEVPDRAGRGAARDRARRAARDRGAPRDRGGAEPPAIRRVRVPERSRRACGSA